MVVSDFNQYCDSVSIQFRVNLSLYTMFVGITFITRSLFEKCFERTHTIAIKTRNEELFHKVKRI